MRRTLRTIAWIGFAAVSLGSPLMLWWLGGCSLLPSTVKQSQELRTSIDQLRGDLNQRTSQITNDLWPIVVLVVAVLLILGAVAVALVMYWINRNSYLRQKPQYEACRTNGGGKP